MLSEFTTFLSVIYSYKIFENNPLSTTIANWLFIMDSLTHFIIILESCYKRSNQIQIIQKFDSIDEIIRNKLGVTIPYRRERCAIFKLVLFLVLLVIIFKALVTVGLHNQGQVFEFWGPSLYTMWIMRIQTIQILFYTCLIRNRLLIINKCLKSIQHLSEIQISREYKSQPMSFTNIDVFQRILDLKHFYGELFESCNLINETFGWSVLAIYVQCFVDFTFNCYWAFVYLGDATFDLIYIVICGSVLLPIIILLGTLTFFCSSCYEWVSFIFIIYVMV